jgi:hypothetical protein
VGSPAAITLDLAVRLEEHAATRGAVLPADQLLRYRDGRALTSRRDDQLWKRIGARLPWVAAQNVSIHWLRHTTLTWSNATSATASPGPTPGIPTTPARQPRPTSS